MLVKGATAGHLIQTNQALQLHLSSVYMTAIFKCVQYALHRPMDFYKFYIICIWKVLLYVGFEGYLTHCKEISKYIFSKSFCEHKQLQTVSKYILLTHDSFINLMCSQTPHNISIAMQADSYVSNHIMSYLILFNEYMIVLLLYKVIKIIRLSRV